MWCDPCGQTIVSLVAIVAGAAAAIFAPLLAERMRRNSNRRDAQLNRRISTYAEVLRVALQLNSNVQTWALNPKATPREPGDEELDRAFAEVRVIGSKTVRDRAMDFSSKVLLFYGTIHFPDRRRRGQAHQDRVAAASKVQQAYMALEQAVRADTAD
jgi:hypothetical protein